MSITKKAKTPLCPFLHHLLFLHHVDKRRPEFFTSPRNCMAWKSNASPDGRRRRVMVVADPTSESVSALQYTISHAMHENDEVILMHVTHSKKPKSIRSYFRRNSDPGLTDISNFDDTFIPNKGGWSRNFMEGMKRTCKAAYPNSRVRIEKVEQGSLDNKGAVILLRCKELAVDLLVIGQRRRTVSGLLGLKRSLSTGSTMRGVSKSLDMAEYLIENSPCSCVAVQKKGQSSGYILNSKTHKNFWLLV